MSNVQLKNYQVKTLDTLKAYLTTARFKTAKEAYEGMDKPGVRNVCPYKPLPGLEDVPFICLRLPTGGGKTLLSAHTVRIASEVYLERDYPLVLWLVPSNTIRQQTLETLKTPGNPNYEALRSAFDGNFMVLDITDFTMIRPHDLASKAVIVVGTVQTIKTEETNTDSRKVYAHNENLEPLFSNIPEGFSGYDKITEGHHQGKIRFSFVNLLRMHRPLVLVDEAHNNSTKLGLELFSRINAACAVEFTATPAKDSNQLHSVSATELKAEEMIKLPIVLTEHQTWNEAVRDSILTRKRLEGLCAGEDQYIRPIVLFQAENQGQDITWQVLKQHLIEVEQIPESKIAVVTGDQRELDGINLFDPSCPIDYVITVQALKEGWDCSFAYVFCSVANIHSAKDVEQILGRVLRMPYAKRRKNEDLNRAYALVSKTSWPNAVMQLHDRLVDKMGFEEQEVDESIETRQPGLNLGRAEEEPFRQPDPVVLHLREPADISEFSDEDKKSIEIEKTKDGLFAKVTGAISSDTIEKLVAKVEPDTKATAKVQLHIHQAALSRAVAPVNRGEKFVIPQLCLRIDGELELPEEGAFLYAGDWKLAGPEKLEESEFKLQSDGKTFAIDIEDGHVKHHFVANTSQMNLDLVDTGWTVNALAQWLDKRLRQPDISQPQMLEYTRRTVAWLEEERKIPLTALSRGRFLLQKVLESKIKKHRGEAKKRGYQALLFGPEPKVEVSGEYTFSFEPDTYHPQKRYQGAFRPMKHFYPVVADMNGEEAECAKAIEMLGDKVKYWVRNIERDPNAFRLPTSTDNFYPDFIVMLNTGRILVVEYKGEDRITTDDTKEKDQLGQLWAKKSGNLFIMARDKDDRGQNVYQQVGSAVK
jgi:type III restriction enzyme